MFDSLLDDDGRSESKIGQPHITFQPMTDGANVVEDYNQVGFSRGLHPLAFLRPDFAKKGYVSCSEAMTSKDNRYVQVAAMVTVRQRPASANGVVFLTMEDETGVANVVIWEKTAELYKRAVYSASLILISGQVQREGEVVHLIARSIANLSDMLAEVGDRNTPLILPHQPGDEFRNGGPNYDRRVPPEELPQVFQKSRDFK